MLLIMPNARYPIATFLSFAVAITIAFAYHEFAHALVADRLGDSTPRAYGRMTLNPIAHLDRTGMILVLLFGFGWASTPVNPYQLRGNRYRSHALVAVAGPAANLIMAVIFALPLFSGLVPLAPPVSTVIPSLYSFLAMAVWTNLFLCLFNLIPIPPLDGFTILQGILPTDLAYQLEPLRRYGFIMLLGVIFFLPYLGINVLGQLIFQPADYILGFLTRGGFVFF